MKRIAIFAHYDKDNKIEDYVVYYLEKLKKVAEQIIFVSDSNIPENEIGKISKIVTHSIVQRHGEYDFGSYKRGFLYALKNGLLENIDECIWANDSCLAPLFPFEELFDTMQHKNVDFWGVTENMFGEKEYDLPHVQSCFLVFKKDLATNKCFIDFVNKIKQQPQKRDIIREYEIGLSQYLINLGYKYAVYVPSSNEVNNLLLERWDSIILENKCPLLKKSILQLQHKGIRTFSVKKVILKTKYPFSIFLDFFNQNKLKDKISFCISEIIVKIKKLRKLRKVKSSV